MASEKSVFLRVWPYTMSIWEAQIGLNGVFLKRKKKACKVCGAIPHPYIPPEHSWVEAAGNIS